MDAEAVTWTDEIMEVLTGDLTVAVAYGTPAGGAVVTAVSPIGLVDRERGVVSFTTSLGFGKKLEHIVRDPCVSLCYHTREHGFSDARPTVLVQGVASVSLEPSPSRIEALQPNIVRFLGEQKSGRFWDWLLFEYDKQRVIVDISVERIVSWPGPAAAGPMSVTGRPWAADVASQQPPAKGTGPRVDVPRTAKQISGLPHRLVAYRGADGFPVVVPVQMGRSDPDGLHLVAAEGLLSQGARRAGLLAHRFAPRCAPLGVLSCTGWLEVSGDTARYAPHTVKAISTPPSKLLQTVGNGALTKYGYHRARRNGQLERLHALASEVDRK
jgi:hypothetical protein